METKTLRKILWSKFLEVVDKSSMWEILLFPIKFCLFFWISYLLIHIDFAIIFLRKTFIENQYAGIKVVLVFIFIFYGKFLLKKLKNIKITTPSVRVNSPHKTFFNIPIFELVDFLFSGNPFKRETVEKVFSIPRNRFDTMAKMMDSVGIFIRGENNGRILNPAFSRWDIVSILESFDGEKLLPLTREISENSFSHLPSMNEIIQRNSPTEGREVDRFIKRPLFQNTA